ncbi:MAG TPA: hypothetical protein VGD62_06000, partial [Acidobacteriaceae bacterium]
VVLAFCGLIPSALAQQVTPTELGIGYYGQTNTNFVNTPYAYRSGYSGPFARFTFNLNRSIALEASAFDSTDLVTARVLRLLCDRSRMARAQAKDNRADPFSFGRPGPCRKHSVRKGRRNSISRPSPCESAARTSPQVFGADHNGVSTATCSTSDSIGF